MKTEIVSEEKKAKASLKFTFDGTGREQAAEFLMKILEECKSNDFGKKITYSDIIAKALMKLTDKDIEVIKRQAMGHKGHILKLFRDSGKDDGSDETFYAWLATDYDPKNLKKIVQ